MSERYEPLLPLGSGGMADVFIGRARSLPFGTPLVALKRARAGAIDEHPGLVDALVREATLVSRLAHRNVVSVIDVELPREGEPTLVLGYVEGCNLADLLVRLDSGLDARIAVRMIVDAARGLGAAHRQAIIHRDVTPSNLLVGVDGTTRISDFGVAKALSYPSERTEAGLLKGKPAYMAPEYVAGGLPTAHCDLFSLAVVAWEAFMGTRLFKGENDIQTLTKIFEFRIPTLASFDPMLAPLDPVLLRALSRSPRLRQTNIDAFADELEAIAAHYGLLGTHAEVAELVEQAFGIELAARRERLRRACERSDLYMRDAATVPVLPRRRARRSRGQLLLGLASASVAFLAALAASSAARSLPPPSPPAPPPPVSHVLAAPVSSASPPAPIVRAVASPKKLASPHAR